MKRIINCLKLDGDCGSFPKLCRYCNTCPHATLATLYSKECEKCSHRCNFCSADCSVCHLACDKRSEDYYNPSRFI